MNNEIGVLLLLIQVTSPCSYRRTGAVIFLPLTLLQVRFSGTDLSPDMLDVAVKKDCFEVIRVPHWYHIRV